MPKRVPRSKAKNTQNVKVSTNDKDEENKIQNNLAERKSIRSQNKKRSSELVLPPINKYNPRGRLKEIKEKNKELEEKLEDLNSKYLYEKAQTMADITKINYDKQQIGKTLQKIEGQNKHYLLLLKDIKEEVEAKVKLMRDFEAKKNKSENDERKLRKRIEVTEKQIQISNNMELVYLQEKERVQFLVDGIDEEKESLLREELGNIELLMLSLQKQIKQLRSVSLLHKTCEKKSAELENKLLIIRNDLEFEIKKSEAVKAKAESSADKGRRARNKTNGENIKNEVKSSGSEKNEGKRLIKRGLFDRKNLSKEKSFKELKGKNNTESDLKFKLRDLWTEFDNIKETNLKNAGNIYSHLLTQEEGGNNKYLYTEEEERILAKLIPKNYLKIFQSRFNKLDKERENLQLKLRGNEPIRQNLQIAKKRVENTSLNIKEINKRKAALNLELSKVNKEVASLNKGISDVKKELFSYKAVVASKNAENKKLLEMYQNFINDIKNGKYKIRKGYKGDIKNDQILIKNISNLSENNIKSEENSNDKTDNLNVGVNKRHNENYDNDEEYEMEGEQGEEGEEEHEDN